MRVQRFEDLISWQKAKTIGIKIYKAFNLSKDFGFKDQIQRAGISISNNIAEGFERNTNKELKQFLYIAKGSCGEVRSMLNIAKELNYINEKDFLELYGISEEVSKLLSAFIKSLK